MGSITSNVLYRWGKTKVSEATTYVGGAIHLVSTTRLFMGIYMRAKREYQKPCPVWTEQEREFQQVCHVWVCMAEGNRRGSGTMSRAGGARHEVRM